MEDLTATEIREITARLVTLRENLRSNGATALTPTPEWNALRKEVALLDKKLNKDAASKRAAQELAAQTASAAQSASTA